ncbi:retrovirus-related pol polyprotein from transposon TNT 1-94 [Tanacetum coccineum]
MFKLDLEPLAQKVLKNKDVHLYYIKHSREHADTLWEIVESARALSPLDSNIDSTCKYVQRIQEVLVYVRDTCPCLTRPIEKLVVVTPKNKDKKVRFAEPITSSNNTQKQVDSHKKDSNQPLLHSIGVIGSTGARGSKPIGNTKNNRISQSSSSNKTNKVVQIVLWYLDSGCSKHITGNRSQLTNFVNRFLGTVKFGNDQIAKIIGYSDSHIGNVTISRVYHVEGLGRNLFSVGQFCDLDLEVAFCKDTCFVHNLKGLVRGLPKLKFEKDHLCSACSLGKSKKQSHKPKSKDTNQEKLYLLYMDLCGLMRVKSINRKKYILVIVDDYSRFTWVKFLRSKDEAPEFIIKFLKMIQVRLNTTIRNIRTDNGIKFVNQTLRSYYEDVGISHETSMARTPQQNSVVERRNRTLVEAARTMLYYFCGQKQLPQLVIPITVP